jgi:protein CsiD
MTNLVSHIQNIEGLQISQNKKSQRIIDIEFKDELIDKLIFPFHKFDITALEYKPFTRFTIAKSLDDLTENKLSRFLNLTIRDRKTGCTIFKTNNKNKKINDIFLTKLSTAISYLIGIPNHDAMMGKFYARFHVKHNDASDSYLRKAYTNMDLHTDGTYVKEKTDWILMTKIEEKNVQGGETSLLHLDDWEHCDELSKDPIGRQSFIWNSPKSKNVDYKVEHPVFFDDEKDRPQISYIDQFPEPKNMKQGNFLQKLSDSLEESNNKIITNLPSGSVLLANNYFWLHGRKPFKENKNLSRELLRIRGSFFTN